MCPPQDQECRSERDPNTARTAQPVGQGNRVVKQGDCISSIAVENGFFWKTLWEHANNRDLREARHDPNVLLPGDRVFVPEKRLRDESGATEQRHRFRKKGEPAKLRLHLLESGSPRANQPYTLAIDGKLFSGSTDGDGRLECTIPPNAKRGRLLVGESHDEYMLPGFHRPGGCHRRGSGAP
jgi:hypothetical protein